MWLEADRLAELFGEPLFDELSQRQALGRVDEGVLRIVPVELVALQMRGNPDLPHRKVGTDNELAWRVFKLNSEGAVVKIYFEVVLLAGLPQGPEELFECGVGAGLEKPVV